MLLDMQLVEDTYTAWFFVPNSREPLERRQFRAIPNGDRILFERSGTDLEYCATTIYASGFVRHIYEECRYRLIRPDQRRRLT